MLPLPVPTAEAHERKKAKWKKKVKRQWMSCIRNHLSFVLAWLKVQLSKEQRRKKENLRSFLHRLISSNEFILKLIIQISFEKTLLARFLSLSHHSLIFNFHLWSFYVQNSQAWIKKLLIEIQILKNSL